MIGLLAPLILIGLVVWIVRTARRSDSDRRDAGAPDLRRFLQYSFLVAALFTAAAGITRLVASVLPHDVIAGRRATDLALGLSLSFVAVPVWVLLWRLVARRLRSDADERAAPAWALYLIAVSTVSLITTFVQAVAVGRWIVGVEPYAPDAPAAALVWGSVWAAHEWLRRRPSLAPTSPLSQLTVMAGSAVGLVALSVGAGGILWYGLGEVYRVVVGSALVEVTTADRVRSSLVLAVLAVPVWWWHWLREGVTGSRTLLWHGYVLFVAVFGGLVTAVTAAGVALHTLLQWLFGVPDAARAAVHFEPLPGALAAAVIGTWVWWYHRAVLDDVEPRRRSEPERTYRYLVAGVGLVAAASGTTMAIMAALQAVTPDAFATADPAGRNTLVVAATLLLLGAPLWGTFWHRLQAEVHAGVDDDLRSPSRRAYLSVVVGLAGLVAFVSLAVVLFVVFRDLLEGTLAVTVLDDLRAAIALVLTAGVVAAYHWSVLRSDRAAAGSEEVTRRRQVLLVSCDGHRLATAVADGTGAKVRRLRRLDSRAPSQEVDAERVNAAILASPHERILVTVDEDGEVHVIPYEPA